MATNYTELNARVASRRDTDANWIAADPILLDGEIVVVDTDTGEVRKKIGDGTSHYSELGFDDEVMKDLVNSKQSILTGTAGQVVGFDEDGNAVAQDAADASAQISTHNTDPTSHTDIREAITAAQAKADSAYELAEGGSPAIIDVVELPTENIQEDAFYRVLTGKFVFNQTVQNNFACHCVDGLPEVGEPVTDINLSTFIFYYNLQDTSVVGHVPDDLATSFGITAGWYTADALFAMYDTPYSGVITDINDDPYDGALRLLLEYDLWQYKNEWTSLKIIGWEGTGAGAEVFNHPSNVASGDSSHAEGYSSHAEGGYSHAEGDYSHAEGNSSHAEGNSSHAEGDYSHAEGGEIYQTVNITGDANATTYTVSSTSGLFVGATLRHRARVDDDSNSDTHTVLRNYTAKITAIDTVNKTITVDETLSETALSNAGVLVYLSGALGDYSHSEGRGAVAAGRAQHAQGEYNIIDPEYDVSNNNSRGTYAHIVGNGSSYTARSNAHTLDWDGNAWFAGDVYVGSTSGTNKDDGSKKLATEAVVDEKIAAIPAPDVSGQISTHNTATDAHNDIRLLVEGLTTRLNTLADSDDTTLDQMSEVVAYIKSNKELIEAITTSKVNVSDIIDNLTTNVANKPLSAAQGVALKALIDAIVVPTKVSELTNDKNYLTSVPAEYVTETELTAKGYLTEHQSLAGYAKTADLGDLATKDSLTASEVGAMPKVAVTTSDNGKFLRVVNGAWAAASIPSAEEASF